MESWEFAVFSFARIRTRGRSLRRKPGYRRLQSRRAVLRGQYDACAAVLDDLCQPCGGHRRVQGKKCSSRPLHRDHCSQEVNAAFGEQDNHFIAADVLTAKPTSNGGSPACELTVTEPNRSGGHRHGVGGTFDLPVKVFGESAEWRQTVSALIPILDDLLPLRYRQKRQTRDPLIWICDN